MNELAQLLADLVAIDSINPDLVPGAAGEATIAHYVAEWLTRAGIAKSTAAPSASTTQSWRL